MSDLHWKSAITKVEPNKLTVRGYRLEELIGRVSYGSMVYLLFKGELPDENRAKMLEAILVSSVDHGTTPPSVLSAITVASTGAPLNAAVAAGILSISKFHGGAIEDCMRVLIDTLKIAGVKNITQKEAVKEQIDNYKKTGKRIAGFGHRIHNNDPRSKRLFDLAAELGIAGEYMDLAQAFVEEFKAMGKNLPLNVDGAIAALLCEMDFDPMLANAFFMMARMPGLVAHVYEEKTRYKPMRKIHPTDVEYDGVEERTL